MRKRESKQTPRLFILNDPTVLRIVPSLAQEIGLNESILLMQIDFLKSVSTAANHKGRPWTYQSIRDLQEEYFPFWSKDTINRAIASLQAKRLIRCGNFNKAAYDKTRWISINYGKCRKLKSIQVGGGLSQNATRSTQNATRSTQNATTIPETSTETTSENKNKTASPVAAPQVNDLLKMIYDHTPNKQSLFADHAIRKAASKAIEQDGFEIVSASLLAYLGNAWVKTNNAFNFKKFFNDKSERERFKPAHVVKTEPQETEAERMAKEWAWMSGTESEILDKMVERYTDPAKLPRELDEWKDRYLKRYEECSKKFVADMEKALAAIP